jgi:sulfoxide reductase heme-binding subunit YedZ
MAVLLVPAAPLVSAAPLVPAALSAVSAPSALVVTSSTPLWYLTRATGLVALVLLTASMVLGLLGTMRYQRPGWPRFVVAGLHRNASLLAVGFTLAHIVTTLADSFVPIRPLDAVVPFISVYRPVWLGLGTLSFDLMLALIITSLLRARLNYQAWHLVHWTSYLCWPVAVLHGLGTGTDTPVSWVLGLTAACVAAVAIGIGYRLASGWPHQPLARLTGAAAVIVALIAGTAWLAAGPLHPGWSRRSGTPPSLLHSGAATRPAPAPAPAGPAAIPPPRRATGSGGLAGFMVTPAPPTHTRPAGREPGRSHPTATSGPATQLPGRNALGPTAGWAGEF